MQCSAVRCGAVQCSAVQSFAVWQVDLSIFTTLVHYSPLRGRMFEGGDSPIMELFSLGDQNMGWKGEVMVLPGVRRNKEKKEGKEFCGGEYVWHNQTLHI